jgi:hypothetical protein
VWVLVVVVVVVVVVAAARLGCACKILPTPTLLELNNKLNTTPKAQDTRFHPQ